MQKVWITGASSGIGEALAKAYACRGATLVLSARNEQELSRVAEACRTLGAKQALVRKLDLSDPASFAAIVERVIDDLGTVDIVIHNGGISQRALVTEASLEVDHRIMQVNYFGAVALTKTLLPYMHKQGGGHFVVVSSVVGKFGSPYRSAYAASKHALHGFFDSLRAEVSGKGFWVTMLCPGFVRTNVTRNALKGDGTTYGKEDPGNAGGLDPDVFAQKALRAIASKKLEVYIGGKEAWAVYLKRFFPGLFARIVAGADVR